MSLTAPRCTHCLCDLSGLVANWEDQCPLRVRCSECGGESRCADVFRQRQAEETLHAGAPGWMRLVLVLGFLIGLMALAMVLDGQWSP